jgi:hypothetical protein
LMRFGTAKKSPKSTMEINAGVNPTRAKMKLESLQTSQPSRCTSQ